MKRDYSLVGDSTRAALEQGLASAEWYHTDVARSEMKTLMKRQDGPAIRDTVLWFALIIASAAGGIYFWGTWLCVPFLFVYGVLQNCLDEHGGL
jgi:fatty acid desaturase